MPKMIHKVIFERHINGNHYELVSTSRKVKGSLEVFSVRRNSSAIVDPRTTVVYFSLMDTVAYDVAQIHKEDQALYNELLSFCRMHEEFVEVQDA